MWGKTFVVVQDAIALYDVLGLLFVRFALAAAALGLKEPAGQPLRNQ